MKFSCSVEIEAPREKVVALWEDTNNLIEWQPGFKAIVPLTGEPGEVGSTSRLVYTYSRGRKMVLIETIKQNELPDLFVGMYEHEHMVNDMTVRFVDVDGMRTRYDVEIHYTEFRAFIPKILSKVFPGMFKKQVLTWSERFKDFVERSP